MDLDGSAVSQVFAAALREAYAHPESESRQNGLENSKIYYEPSHTVRFISDPDEMEWGGMGINMWWGVDLCVLRLKDLTFEKLN